MEINPGISILEQQANLLKTFLTFCWFNDGPKFCLNRINFSFLPRRGTSASQMNRPACRPRAFPANTKHLYNIYTTSAQRLRRCFVFAGLWREVLWWLDLWSFAFLGWHWPRDINLSQYKMWIEVVLLCGVSYVVQSQNTVIVPISSEHWLPFWLWVLMWSRYRTLWSISEFLFIYLPSTQN